MLGTTLFQLLEDVLNYIYQLGDEFIEESNVGNDLLDL
jgi:hypothetical protein